MKFLLDQDVYAITARFLNHLGHDVIQVAQIGMSHLEDELAQSFVVIEPGGHRIRKITKR
jgi:hypothetical protein